MFKRSLVPAMICSSFLLAVGCGSSTATPGGTGGSSNAGTGGSSNNGSGGATNNGSGGSSNNGSGGSSNNGSGGATNNGSGGSSNNGSGGSSNNGSGGASNTGSGGTTSAGSGGTTSAGSGGTSPGGSTGTAGSTGTGGAPPAGGNEFWISPTGKDTNAGTKESPLFTLCDDELKTGACYKICPMGGTCIAGTATIWVMDGTYKYGKIQKIGSTKNGTAAGNYNVFAVAGAKPVFDFTGQAVSADNRGIQHQGNYWHYKGITVTKAGDTGFFVMGSNNLIELCIAHHNQDMGFAIGVNKSQTGSGQNNTILNCDSYQNRDDANGGENADGFGLKENTGAGNKFSGCRAWDNADDGWDFYGWTSPVTVENCWAMSSSKTTSGGNSDGNGFKLGGNGVSAAHVLKNCYATDNKYGSSGKGIIKNSNPGAISCTGCAAWDNKAASDVSGVSTTAPGSATAAKMIAAQRDATGNLPDITKL